MSSVTGRQVSHQKSLIWIVLCFFFGLGIWYANFQFVPDQDRDEHNQISSTQKNKIELLSGFAFPKTRPLPMFSLSNEKGQTITENDFKGKWHVIFPGYTFCPDICPTTLNVLSKVEKQLSTEEKDLIQFVFLSVDPERDIPGRLDEYLSFFNTAFKGMTGDMQELGKLTSSMGVTFRYVKQSEDDTEYAVDHTSRLFVYNPKGERVALINPVHGKGVAHFDPALILHDLRVLLKTQ